MRHTKGHTRNRRSHHALGGPRLTKCVNCGAQHLMHRVCENCGKYRNKVVIDVEAKLAKKTDKAKRRRMEMEQAGVRTKSNKGTDQTEKNPKKIGEVKTKKEEVKNKPMRRTTNNPE
jgi:large subunit ribosomal protein L32